ncbi:MAG: hypothetical protein K0M45_00125, partial [Candidatus Paracaedibacteraceae bacterium]|nr:hypothetical protein [Candidatus Paracaedibacteraceae bacterium]
MTAFSLLPNRKALSTQRSKKSWLASLLLLQVFTYPLNAMDDPNASSPLASKKQLDDLREGMVESFPTSLPSYDHASPKEDHAERKALFDKIIQVTQAEYDWPYHVKKSLEQFIPTCQDPDLQKNLET